jgi:hypothetical protein
MCNGTLQENYELQLSGMSDSLAAVSLDVEPKAKSDSSSPEVPGNCCAIEFDCSSPDSSDSSSEDGSGIFSSDGSNSSSPNGSSPNSLQTTFPDSNVLKTSDLFEDTSKESQNPQLNAVWDTSSQSDSDVETVILWNPAAKNDCDMDSADDPTEDSNTETSTAWDASSQSDSDAETVILGKAASKDDADMVFPNNPGSEESRAVSGDCIQGNPDDKKSNASDSGSDDGSDSSSQDCSDTFSPAGPRSISPASSTTLFQVPLDTEEHELRIPQGSQSICAYASPVQNGCRIRTSCDRNDDTGRWHVEPDGFINEAGRAGGPYLFPLPVQELRLSLDDPLHDILEDYRVVQRITSILAEHGIHPLSMRLRKCEYGLFNRFDYLPTLIFSATRDTVDDSWVQACRQIWNHLSNVGLGQVNVEISEFEIKPTYTWIMKRTDRVYPVYMDLLHRIQSELDVTGMIRLAVHREGTTDSRENLPLTVGMTVEYDSTRDWRDTRDGIVKILDDMNLPMVGVIIRKGKNYRG